MICFFNTKDDIKKKAVIEKLLLNNYTFSGETDVHTLLHIFAGYNLIHWDIKQKSINAYSNKNGYLDYYPQSYEILTLEEMDDYLSKKDIILEKNLALKQWFQKE